MKLMRVFNSTFSPIKQEIIISIIQCLNHQVMNAHRYVMFNYDSMKQVIEYDIAFLNILYDLKGLKEC